MITFVIWGLIATVSALLGAALIRPKDVVPYAIAAIPTFIIGGMLGWIFTPTLNPAFSYVWYTSILFFVIGGTLASMVPPKTTAEEKRYGSRRLKFNPLPLSAGICALVIFWIGGFIATDSLFHAGSYHRLLGRPKVVATFGQDVAPVDTAKLRVVNKAFATQIADKTIGEQQGLGSQATLDSMHIAQLNGCFTVRTVESGNRERLCFEHELVWVAPLVHSGFFRWLANRDTHQYALVSASDPSRRYLVDEVNGKRVSLRYHLHGAHFGDWLVRHLRENGYLTRGLTDYNFELDDQGRPWWVAVTYKKRVGFSGEDPTGVVVVNPATGAIREYGLDQVPVWVDRVQPEDITLAQFDRWGKYVNGWLNSWTSRRGVVQTSTHDLHLVEGKNGRTYWYTGVTSVGNDQSTTGFVLIDTKTKEVRLYRVPGATEEAAQLSAENAPGVKEKQYAAGEPVLYNLGGHPTYLMTLSGEDNVPRMYAFVSVCDFQLVGVGEAIPTALHRYETVLRGSGRAAIGQAVVSKETAEGTVLRIVREGDAWAMLLPGEVRLEYYVPGNINPEVKYTKEGDRVRVGYQKAPDRIDQAVLSFDNLELKLVE